MMLCSAQHSVQQYCFMLQLMNQINHLSRLFVWYQTAEGFRIHAAAEVTRLNKGSQSKQTLCLFLSIVVPFTLSLRMNDKVLVFWQRWSGRTWVCVEARLHCVHTDRHKHNLSMEYTHNLSPTRPQLHEWNTFHQTAPGSDSFSLRVLFLRRRTSLTLCSLTLLWQTVYTVHMQLSEDFQHWLKWAMFLSLTSYRSYSVGQRSSFLLQHLSFSSSFTLVAWEKQRRRSGIVTEQFWHQLVSSRGSTTLDLCTLLNHDKPLAEVYP